MSTPEHELLPQEKYMLTIKEAAVYFNIGVKKMRRIAEDARNGVGIYMGNRYLVIRHKFEAYIENMLREAALKDSHSIADSSDAV